MATHPFDGVNDKPERKPERKPKRQFPVTTGPATEEGTTDALGEEGGGKPPFTTLTNHEEGGKR